MRAVPFAVVACSNCRIAWAVDLRHASACCPNCSATVDLARRARLWEGDDAREAQRAAGDLRLRVATGEQAPTATAQVVQLRERRVAAKHDSPVDAAAAKARGITNQSERAEAVALWMTRLVGDTPHEQLVEAMRRAGLSGERAEKEIVRLLVCDLLFEPRAGHYRVLDG